ncbi:MAG: protein translocase subunit SecF [Oceanicaulis sp.]|uniref:protein translocase subunit SecF n=1 Tax=Oceanicaulis TaxID=153232 RepID=UPI0003B7B4A3|nr:MULTISPECIES: protein translocase subunit SecF [Oceanicaulis]MAP49268.1 protein translocase subunit SecF [Oceanicaulis sp.]VXC70707.1 Protein translocase subunit SecF [Oceanicaulis sp. 350]HCR67448.1 protein translocase subunit SecF [Oceanicaulis sp.]|tara:strand:- start:1951 stop:2934 length:984 start_codon:yes stop_codon:yes gene_type:complete
MSLALVRLIPTDTAVPFIKARLVAFFISVALILGSITAFATLGLNFGIDFRGGTAIEVKTQGPADTGALREVLSGLDLGDVQVQGFGAEDEALVRVGLVSSERVNEIEGYTVANDAEAQQAVRQMVSLALEEAFPGIVFQKTESLSPQVSGELVVAGATSIGVALFLMLIYIWFRFEWQYSVGAVLALIHDVIATIGFFAITQLEFNLSTIAAILTIVGYSMNDTVIVYDRIREDFRKFKTRPTVDVLNGAINSTLSRTILTSGTTLIAIVAMAVIGGPALEGFALALIWGVGVGTYSSIFVAAPLLTLTGVKREANEDGNGGALAP